MTSLAPQHNPEKTARAVVAEASDVMLYGGGGAGKTTPAASTSPVTLAAGDDWPSAFAVPDRAPRPDCRERRPTATVPPLRAEDRRLGRPAPSEGRVHVWEEPWASSRSPTRHGARFAERIRELPIDVVVVGPLTASGMLENGTQDCKPRPGDFHSGSRTSAALAPTVASPSPHPPREQVRGRLQCGEGVGDTCST